MLNIDIEVFVFVLGKCALNTESELFVVSFTIPRTVVSRTTSIGKCLPAEAAGERRVRRRRGAVREAQAADGGRCRGSSLDPYSRWRLVVSGEPRLIVSFDTEGVGRRIIGPECGEALRRAIL